MALFSACDDCGTSESSTHSSTFCLLLKRAHAVTPTAAAAAAAAAAAPAAHQVHAPISVQPALKHATAPDGHTAMPFDLMHQKEQKASSGEGSETLFFDLPSLLMQCEQ